MTVSPIYSLFGVQISGNLSRACSGTNSSPSEFGVNFICSLLSKLNSACVNGVFSRVRLPAPSSTILIRSPGRIEQAPERRHDRILGVSMRGFQKWA